MLRSRYDPATNPFTQEDPIGLAGGLNLYGFAGGYPINFSDPFGLCPEWQLAFLLSYYRAIRWYSLPSKVPRRCTTTTPWHIRVAGYKPLGQKRSGVVTEVGPCPSRTPRVIPDESAMTADRHRGVVGVLKPIRCGLRVRNRDLARPDPAFRRRLRQRERTNRLMEPVQAMRLSLSISTAATRVFRTNVVLQALVLTACITGGSATQRETSGYVVVGPRWAPELRAAGGDTARELSTENVTPAVQAAARALATADSLGLPDCNRYFGAADRTLVLFSTVCGRDWGSVYGSRVYGIFERRGELVRIFRAHGQDEIVKVEPFLRIERP